ncbi:MAG: PAS domain-containing sensor histidine kinase [Desulfovibrionaceae bacterium]|nr:PAS domain-containing sensor histidine kinase [Desulfovibrionaceae bacterium]
MRTDDDHINTFFAPAQRADQDEIRRQHQILVRSPCRGMVDSVPTIIMVLNQNRQLVFANKALLAFLGLDGLSSILGLRPGEIFGCVHCKDAPGGCGTSRFCSKCGAVKTILAGIAGQESTNECHLLCKRNGVVQAMDLLVSGAAFEFESEQFNAFSIVDMSHEKRRRALERVFFHDILNLAGGIRGLAEVVRDEAPESLKEEARVLHRGLADLVEEILSQKDLAAAEENELIPEFAGLGSLGVLDRVLRTYSRHELARGKSILVDPAAVDVRFSSDAKLIGRVLGNMVKNALEATELGGEVGMGCDRDGEKLTFWVQNPGAMDKDVQLQIFNRSFSTKGRRRGLGTYSIKLLTERYLGGEVGFSSNEREGTRFWMTVPLKVPAAAGPVATISNQ